VIRDARDAAAQARRDLGLGNLQRRGHGREPRGRDDHAVLFVLEQPRQESRPAARLGWQHQRGRLPAMRAERASRASSR
jgi:hypothetical protein